MGKQYLEHRGQSVIYHMAVTLKKHTHTHTYISPNKIRSNDDNRGIVKPGACSKY